MESSLPLPDRGASAPGVGDTPDCTRAHVSHGQRRSTDRGSTNLAAALTALADLGKRLGDKALVEEADAALLPLEQNILRVVALGQFKRGKSTLLNALLGVRLLPTGATPVTSISTLVRWAPNPSLTVRYMRGESEQVAIEELPAFVVEARNPDNILGVDLVEVGYPAAVLEDGLLLVDTPGIGSTDRRATERAYGFLPSVDAGLVVLSPDPPVGKEEASYIREVAALTPHLLFVLNKIDRVAEAEWREVLSFNRKVLAGILERDVQDIEIIPVSARGSLEEGDPSVEGLRERIEDFVARKGDRVREELARRRLLNMAAKLRARLGVERRVLELEEQDLEQRIDALRGTLASLEGHAERTAPAMMAAVEAIVGRAGDAMLAQARTGVGKLTDILCDLVGQAPAGESNAALAVRFDKALAESTWSVLDSWWEAYGPGAVRSLLGEMGRAADDLAQARRGACDWIQEAFDVTLWEEPRVEALKESGNFYRRVEGVTPKLTADIVRTLLPRSFYRRRVRKRAPHLAAQALDMGTGQVRGDMLYRARETARTFTAQLHAWTLAGMDSLSDAADRAALLRLETGRAAEQRRRELDESIIELDDLVGGCS